jgi:hypothetical protein
MENCKCGCKDPHIHTMDDGRIYYYGVSDSSGLVSCIWATTFPESEPDKFIPVKIIYGDPYTTCFFKDGEKITVKSEPGEKYSKETGVMSCISKKIFGSRNQFLKLLKSGRTQLTREEKVTMRTERKLAKEKDSAAKRQMAAKKKADKDKIIAIVRAVMEAINEE